ncbi:ubiquitin carboxyl-terminal hydrolase [Histoplasma capsulatum G186AR]|uniref:Ubiquitin carboxyl-terminal hydrolase n=1 Tax=Ajellomyces capsulatus TaxID=5037 RepID=A0A8H7Y9L7_AJECA|nr:ubiquitin carboxyl-terminal hydrolase [Histoplasma capsulatum]QSS70872.1 ubiquitin carboxyl-terminal hydrolase [Histoplasma capsulatum G186AR]
MAAQMSQSGQPQAMENEPNPLANNYDAMMAKLLPVDPTLETADQSHFTWCLPNWTKLEKTELGPKFECGGSRWRVLLHPYGNQQNQHLSIYLKHGFDEGELPVHWNACVQFSLVLWNTTSPEAYISQQANFRFTIDNPDWGFTKFCELRKLLGRLGDKPSLLGNDEANITAYVRVIRDYTGVLWHTFHNYDSKKTTGFVGLKNLGSTGYLNVILQCFYFTNKFRKATYQLQHDDKSGGNTFLSALQRLFYHLQTNDQSASPLELTRALGWGPQHLFMQQDVHEMARLLMDRFLEEPTFSGIFRGKTKSYVSLDGVQQSKIENFWDISINVQNIQSLEASLTEYIRENVSEEHRANGIQKTTSGVILETLPDVLHLHLKRYAYDMTQRQLVKVNDFFAYPEEFDASPYLSADTDRSESWVYRLTGVVVHSGGVYHGRYWVFLRPAANMPFFKFDDEQVTRAMLRNAIEDNYGGEGRVTNAYMLIYVRKSRINDILADVTTADVPESIRNGFLQEQEAAERLKKEQEEQHLYLQITLSSVTQFRLHDGFDLTSPNVGNSGTATLRVRKETLVSELIQKVAEKMGLGHGQCTLWICINRQNGTRRPHEPLLRTNITMEQAYLDVGFVGPNPHIWVETSPAGTRIPSPVPQATDGGVMILIFIKNFDVVNQTLCGVTSIYVRKDSTVRPHILTVMQWPEDSRFSVHEEVKPSMILNVDPNSTFERAELGNGDILCVQKLVKRSEYPHNLLAKDVSQYFDNLRNERNKQKYT